MTGLVLEDIVLETIRSLVLAAIWLGLLRYRHARRLAGEPGWRWLITGFGLVFVGSLFDLSDNFPALNHFVLIGDTPAEAFLEKFVGYLGGFTAIAIGIWRWLPAMVQARSQVQQYQAQARRPLLHPERAEQHPSSLAETMALFSDNARFFDAVMNTLAEGVMVSDARQRIIYANPAAERLLQGQQATLAGHRLTELPLDPCVIEAVQTTLRVTREAAQVQRLETALLPPGKGPPLPVQVSITALTTLQQTLAVVVFEDISERKRLEHALREQAIRDPLTGLYNRREMQQRLEQELARARRNGEPLVVAMLDIDHFKVINDSYGHQAGDAVLQELARRFSQHVRKTDIVARYGGEEFLLILPQTGLAEARVLVERLRRTIAGRPFVTPAGAIPVTISIGLAEYPTQATVRDGLIAAADRALYAAKQQGRNRVLGADETHAALPRESAK
jgi:diguanylate cyclase (GGDEF)-like protein/PAS domain S-box-containing protein